MSSSVPPGARLRYRHGRTLATFHRAHYHVYPLGLDAPGDEAVRGLLGAVFDAFPDFEFVAERTCHAVDAHRARPSLT